MSDTRTFDVTVVQESSGEYQIEASTKSEAIDIALEFARDGRLDTDRRVDEITEVDNTND